MTIIKIKGMSCKHCVMSVKKVLAGIDGVQNVDVDLASGEASFDATQPIDLDAVRERIKKAGYEVV
jgi:copper chaperone